MSKILVFKSSTCPPCKMLTPVIAQIKRDNELDITEYYIDQSDEGQNLAMSYGVSSVPTIIKIDEDGAINQVVGFRPRALLEEWFTA